MLLEVLYPGYMCLSILHYLLNALKHVWNVGIRWEIQVWNPSKYTPEQKQIMAAKEHDMMAVYEALGLTVNSKKVQHGMGKY